MSSSRSNDPLFCGVCNISVSSDSCMRTHIQGKRHIDLEKHQQNQMTTSAKSIYVRGYPLGSTAEQLSQFFQAIGKVEKVILGKENGLYAIVEFASPTTAKRVLSMPGILMMGESMLIIRPRQLKGCPMKSKSSPEKSASLAADAANLDDLLERMQQCPNMKDEMELLAEEFSLSSADSLQRYKVCLELEKILRRNLFPDGCRVLPFGSSVNGLGSKGCDLDLFLNLSSDGTLDDLPFRPDDLLWGAQVLSECPGTSSDCLEEEPVAPTEEPIAGTSESENVPDLVRKISNLLRSQNDTYTQVLRIASTRCPVVKFVHRRSGLKCDLSINNRLALCNTILIKLLLDLDDRIRPLIVSIRRWAKLREVASQENTGSKLTSYALTMMVIYYLQTVKPPLLPSIEELSCLTENRHAVDGWDCTFTTDLSKFPKTENTLSAEELLVGFFRTFDHFDFSRNIISVRLGKSVDLAAFSEQIASNPRLKDFKISPILIQDPFVLNHNVAFNVNEKSRQAIQKSLLAVTSVFRNKSTSEDDQGPRLYPLFLPETGSQQNSDSLHSEPEIHDDKDLDGGNNGSQKFTIKVEVAKLMGRCQETGESLSEIQGIWCRNMETIVRETLKIFHVNYTLVIGKDRDSREESLSHGYASDKESREDGDEAHLHEPLGEGNSENSRSRKKRYLTENRGSSTSQKRTKHSPHQSPSTEPDFANVGTMEPDDDTSSDLSEAFDMPNDSDSEHGTSFVRDCSPAFSLRCSTSAKTWISRKKMRKHLSHITDERKKEAEISRLIVSEQNRNNAERRRDGTGDVSLAFDVLVWLERIPETAMTVVLQPDNGVQSSPFKCFLFSFRSVLEKMVNKYALENVQKWNDETEEIATSSSTGEFYS